MPLESFKVRIFDHTLHHTTVLFIHFANFYIKLLPAYFRSTILDCEMYRNGISTTTSTTLVGLVQRQISVTLLYHTIYF